MILTKTDFPDLKLLNRGKVRDIYDFGNKLLIVASDRLSAFDVVFGDGIPEKGKVLTQLSLFWFDKTKKIIKSHLITANIDEYPKEAQKYREILEGRSMMVKKAKPFEVECVIRGYLDGSSYVDYKNTGMVCGIKLPKGLEKKSWLQEPIFTPATKAQTGHDENITFDIVVKMIGQETANFLRDTGIKLYSFARDLMLKKGIILSDTKFEFGKLNNEIILIDEVLTPDSSRFWEKETYQPGIESKSFDKQYVRDYVTDIGWDRKPPAPRLPEDVIRNTSKRYTDIYKLITGKEIF